jgi:hypothetical protein
MRIYVVSTPAGDAYPIPGYRRALAFAAWLNAHGTPAAIMRGKLAKQWKETP